jgi:hypothetical protein
LLGNRAADGGVTGLEFGVAGAETEVNQSGAIYDGIV